MTVKKSFFFLNYEQNVHVGKNFLNDVELRKSVKTCFNPNDGYERNVRIRKSANLRRNNVV